MPVDDGLLAGMEPVPLDVIDTTSVVPRRHDRKYVVLPETLDRLAEPLARDFLALEIDGRRMFRYKTSYFDDDELRCYHDHRQGRRRRYKVRVRSYVESDLHFLEVKLKALRGTTLKLRRPYHHGGAALSCSVARTFVNNVLDEAYGVGQDKLLLARLDVHYSRSTLVSREGDERITIDRHVSFRADAQSCHVADDRLIIESKGPRCNGKLDILLRRLGHRPVQGCSKYCIGMAATRQVRQINRFLPAMRRLGCAGPTRHGSTAMDATPD